MSGTSLSSPSPGRVSEQLAFRLGCERAQFAASLKLVPFGDQTEACNAPDSGHVLLRPQGSIAMVLFGP